MKYYKYYGSIRRNMDQYSLEFYGVNEEVEDDVRQNIRNLLIPLGHNDMVDPIYTCVKELLINAIKANYKNIFFEGYKPVNKDNALPYEKALQETIQPGDVVLDIGAGTGIFSFLACQLGAGKVYAIEPDQAVQLAREIAIANNMSDKITFIEDFSTRIDLPEPVDVIVSDLRGVLFVFVRRRRYLGTGGPRFAALRPEPGIPPAGQAGRLLPARLRQCRGEPGLRRNLQRRAGWLLFAPES